MSGWNGEFERLLSGADPLGVVYYNSTAERDDLLELGALLLPANRRLVKATALDALFDPANAEAVVAVLLPAFNDETVAVRRLEEVRDSLLSRRAPGLLFLFAGSEASRVLRESPALASWLRGREFSANPNEYDPEEGQPQDFDRARARFIARIGRTPEVWLDAWKRGAEPTTLANDMLAVEAERLRENPP